MYKKIIAFTAAVYMMTACTTVPITGRRQLNLVSDFIPLTLFPNLKNINFKLNVNGETKQKGNSQLMMNDFDDIITYISRFITLKTGDIIFTGTPEGVGPVKIGDRLEGYVEDRKLLDFEIK